MSCISISPGLKSSGMKGWIACHRLVFAAGVCAAYIVATGNHALDTSALYFSEKALLWTAAARAAQAALSYQACLAESIQATDTWATDTGGTKRQNIKFSVVMKFFSSCLLGRIHARTCELQSEMLSDFLRM